MNDNELLNDYFMKNSVEMELYRMNVTPETTQSVHDSMVRHGISKRFVGAFLCGVLFGQFQDKERGM